MFASGRIGLSILTLLQVCLFSTAFTYAQVEITEQTTDRAMTTQIAVTVKGKLFTPQQGDAKISLPIELKAESRFVERRLPSAGREERAYRSIRLMDRTIADIKIGDETTRSTLPLQLKRVVVEGDKEGLFLYSPDVYMSRNNIELLGMPCDPLSVLPLLPTTAVKVGDEWQTDSWIGSMLTSMEATLKSEIKCKLLSLDDKQAVIQFQGQVQGAVTGSNSTIDVTGQIFFNVTDKYVEKITATQIEKREIGTVSPGMDVTAEMTVFRNPIAVPEQLNDLVTEKIPLDPDNKVKSLVYQSGDWKLQFFHDRNWHIFQELPHVVVLRLVEQGNLLSQCNIAVVQSTKPGEHTPYPKFQDDIVKSLGARFTELLEEKSLDAPEGCFIYRVKVAGKANDLAMQWHYYLFTNRDGRQVSFAFALEPKQAEKLQDRDFAVVRSVHFLPE